MEGIDLDGAIWSIRAAKMKMWRPHPIPRAARAVTLLFEVHGITGNGRFLFPSNRSRERCMSENTINAALRRSASQRTKCPRMALVRRPLRC